MEKEWKYPPNLPKDGTAQTMEYQLPARVSGMGSVSAPH